MGKLCNPTLQMQIPAKDDVQNFAINPGLHFFWKTLSREQEKMKKSWVFTEFSWETQEKPRKCVKQHWLAH